MDVDGPNNEIEKREPYITLNSNLIKNYVYQYIEWIKTKKIEFCLTKNEPLNTLLGSIYYTCNIENFDINNKNYLKKKQDIEKIYHNTIKEEIQKLIALFHKNKKHFIVYSAIERVFTYVSNKVKANVDRVLLEVDLLNNTFLLDEISKFKIDENEIYLNDHNYTENIIQNIKLYIDNYLKDRLLQGIKNVEHTIAFPKYMENNPHRFDLWKQYIHERFQQDPLPIELLREQIHAKFKRNQYDIPFDLIKKCTEILLEKEENRIRHKQSLLSLYDQCKIHVLHTILSGIKNIKETKNKHYKEENNLNVEDKIYDNQECFLFFEPFLHTKHQLFLKEYGTRWAYLCFDEAVQNHDYDVLYPFLPELRAYPFTLKEFHKLSQKIIFDTDGNALLTYTTKGVNSNSKKRKHSYSLKPRELEQIKKLQQVLDNWQVSHLKDNIFKRL